ncbi:hypothetical protein N407_03555 [Helicobacter pylori FD662]|nr:hypothetical protein N407_03555 [Helicobacter pylori FD662]
MPYIRNLDLSLPDLTERLYKISRRLYIMRSSCSFLAREYCVLERMHEVIQKGMDSLTQRLDNDLKDDRSRILVPIKYISDLCLVSGNMKPDELCILFVKIFDLIRSEFKSNLFRNSLSFMGGVISDLNRQICMY